MNAQEQINNNLLSSVSILQKHVELLTDVVMDLAKRVKDLESQVGFPLVEDSPRPVSNEERFRLTGKS